MKKMVRFWVILATIGVFWYLPLASFGDEFVSRDRIAKVKGHSVGVAVYYYMDEVEFYKRLEARKSRAYYSHRLQTKEIVAQLGEEDGVLVTIPEGRQLIVPVSPKLTVKGPPGIEIYTLAYIGSGTILKNNHVLTAHHMVGQETAYSGEVYGMQVFIFLQGWDHAPECDVVALSEHQTFADDYAVIKSREPLGVPGVKISKPDKLKVGDKAIVVGSPAGVVWTMRFNHISQNRWYLQRGTGEDQGIQLVQFETFPYWTFYEGTYGDSGGGLFTQNGELASVNYCGIDLYGINLLFSNPTSHLWDFLKKNKLEDLAR